MQQNEYDEGISKERPREREKERDRKVIQMRETNHMHVEIALGHEKCVLCYLFGVFETKMRTNKQAQQYQRVKKTTTFN